MATVLDFSAGFPRGADIKAAGHVGVVAYISDGREPWMHGKPLNKRVVDDYRAHGLGIAVVHQYGPGTREGSDVMGGYASGVTDAILSDNRLKDLGMTGWPVFFACDFDISLDDYNTTVSEYLRGAGSVLGKHRVGLYGHSKVVHWAGPEDRLIAEVAPGRFLGWVTRSWSSGKTGSDYAVLYQRVHNTPGPSGIKVDINDVFHHEWGQNPTTPTSEVDVTNLPRVTKTRWLNKHYTAGRAGHKIKKITRHHMAGIGGTDQCWQWWQSRQASAHFAVQDDEVGQLVRESDTAWSNANSYSNFTSITIEHSNSAGAAQDWPISDLTLRNGAHLAAELCLKHGLGRPKFGVNIDDHRNHTSTGCPYHLAEGGKYHNTWMKYAQEHYDNLKQGGFLMALSDAEQRELLEKTRRIDHELTYRFQSRYVDPETGEQSPFRDTLVGYVLELDKKAESVNAVRLPGIDKAISALSGLLGKNK